MTRVEFTANIVDLLYRMRLEGESPIIDFVKRSDEEQKRLFDAGLSKCDGVHKISKHQIGKAMDIYFISDGRLVSPTLGYPYWHDVWEEMGGGNRIDWDEVHFEG